MGCTSRRIHERTQDTVRTITSYQLNVLLHELGQTDRVFYEAAEVLQEVYPEGREELEVPDHREERCTWGRDWRLERMQEEPIEDEDILTDEIGVEDVWAE
jgi:hypothetical protein